MNQAHRMTSQSPIRAPRACSPRAVLSATVGVALVVFFHSPTWALAQPMPLEAKLQTAVLKKIFQYDKDVVARGSKVLVLSSPGTDDAAKGVVAAFASVGVAATSATAKELNAKIGDSAVVYVFAADYTDQIAEMCAKQKVLSVSGHPELAENGKVSVALGIANSKPEIIVNLSRMKAESHSLPSPLLKLARVVK
jgi:hypothetical protein